MVSAHRDETDRAVKTRACEILQTDARHMESAWNIWRLGSSESRGSAAALWEGARAENAGMQWPDMNIVFQNPLSTVLDLSRLQSVEG